MPQSGECLSIGEKQRIAGRARTIRERLDAPFARDSSERDAEELLAEWAEYVGGGDAERFRRRLDREDLGRKACGRRLATDAWPEAEPLPDWVEELERILSAVLGTDPGQVSTTADDDVPFVDVLSPIVRYAENEVSAPLTDRLSNAAIADLNGWLTTQLSQLSSHSLFIAFRKYVASRDQETPGVTGDRPDSWYAAFTTHLLDGGLRAFLREYSFLARLVVDSIRQWVSGIEELYDRLDRDWSRILEAFFDGAEPDVVTGIDVVGDVHADGRRVLVLTFDEGTKVVYKPRNSGIVEGFYGLLEWLNEHADLPAFRLLGVVARDEYAWMDWVETAECDTRHDVERYYRRAGMLVCLFYTLGAVDMHMKNVVAAGGQPVVVDLETLGNARLRPRYRWDREPDDARGTVLETGAVPDHGEDGESIACFWTDRIEYAGGLHGFTDANTDRMELVEEDTVPVVGDNLPRLDGEVVGPQAHVEAITRGFEELYEFLLENRDRILAEDGPLERLRTGRTAVTIVYRDSVYYENMRRFMTQQPNLRTGLRFGLKVEVLAKPLLSAETPPAAWSLFEAERRVLRRWNFPRFRADVHGTDLRCAGELVAEDVLERSPVAWMRARIREFDRRDLATQLELVERGYRGEPEPAE